MEDRAVYILMGAYIVLFACLFVCVFGAMIVLVREQTAAEGAAAPVADARPPMRIAVATSDAVGSNAPGAVAATAPRIAST